MTIRSAAAACIGVECCTIEGRKLSERMPWYMESPIAMMSGWLS